MEIGSSLLCDGTLHQHSALSSEPLTTDVDHLRGGEHRDVTGMLSYSKPLQQQTSHHMDCFDMGATVDASNHTVTNEALTQLTVAYTKKQNADG